MSSITCSGSIALDITRTPFHIAEMVLGGAASYFSLAASFFAPVSISSIVGTDFPNEHWEIFKQRNIDTSGVEIKAGKTFHYDSSFSYDLYKRTTLKTELNVLGGFKPKLSDTAKQSEFLYLATMPPETQLDVLKQSKCKLSFLDTIQFYIEGSRSALLEVMAKVDGIVLNDDEGRMLSNEVNLVKAGKKIHALGPKIVILKKGEHGSLLFFDNNVIPFPAFPLEDLKDPTGAGDAFAGGFVGSLAAQGVDKKLGLGNLKIAMGYGNVMGSIAVEDFSVHNLDKISMKEVENRFWDYCELLKI
ncbi:MAG: PfkB family carbohydrate kinase [Candidatus Micrarchaeota archaeon]